MAEYAQAPRLQSRSPSSTLGLAAQTESLPPKLPERRGSCNFRDLSVGHTCGCTTFWDKEGHSVPKDNGSAETTLWCVCGHHACFHALVQPRAARGNDAAAPTLPGKLLKHDGHWYMRLTQETPDASTQTAGKREEAAQTADHAKATDPDKHHERGQTSAHAAPGLSLGSQFRMPFEDIVGLDNTVPSIGLPSIPSGCLLGSDELKLFGNQNRLSAEPATQDLFTKSGSFIREPSGLGLSLQSDKARDKEAGKISQQRADLDVRRSWNESIPPSTRPSSSTGPATRASPSRAFLQHVLNKGNGLPNLEVPQSLPPQLDADDVIQSATEVATPSNANTPDLRAGDQNFAELKNVFDVLARAFGSPERFGGPAGRMPGLSPQLLLPGPSTSQAETVQNAIKSLPSALSKVIAFVTSAQGHLGSVSQLSTSLTSLAGRVDSLENASFHHIPPEELDNRFESLDGRLLEVETWKEDHDRNHSHNPAKSFERAYPLGLPGSAARDGGSFTSIHSNGSASALVGVMLEKQEIDGIKERIDDLESAAMPSAASPWTVEVVLLPWGRGLRGIWYSLEDATSSNYRGSPVESEEWTQAMSIRSARSTSRASVTNTDHGRGGWDSQAIHAWADSAEEWLSPKACGSKNVVYRRLKSRGFVRNVTLQSANAGDIQAALKLAFKDLLDLFDLNQSLSPESAAIVDEVLSVHPALKAPFIPLRKIPKNSKLHFLRPAELTTSALWTAQFLASGILMRFPGGQRRLYMTHRDAYTQNHDKAGVPWTWQRLRELPRAHIAQGSQSSGSGAHVGEADAKEACWAYYPAFDPPISVTSSFASESSMQSAVPEPRSVQNSPKQSGLSADPKIEVANAPPISPLSEFAKGRIAPLRRVRTVSAPLTDENSAVKFSSTQQQSNSLAVGKRRNASFEASLPSSAFASMPSVPISSVPKRRRLTRSPGTEGSLYNRMWGLTPRRSKEPPSPFFDERSGAGSEGAGTSNSTAVISAYHMAANAPLPQQQQHQPAARKRGPTPSAYATPHSGSGMGFNEPRAFFGVGGAGTEGGDTEVDSEHERDQDDKGDGESWHGLVGDEDDSRDINNGSDNRGQGAGPACDDMSVDGGAEDPADGDSESSGFGDEDDDDDELYESD